MPGGVRLGEGRQRALLALLLLRPNQVVVERSIGRRAVGRGARPDRAEDAPEVRVAAADDARRPRIGRRGSADRDPRPGLPAAHRAGRARRDAGSSGCWPRVGGRGPQDGPRRPTSCARPSRSGVARRSRSSRIARSPGRGRPARGDAPSRPRGADQRRPRSRAPRRCHRGARDPGRRPAASGATSGPAHACALPFRSAGGGAPGLPRYAAHVRRRAGARSVARAAATRARDPRPGSVARLGRATVARRSDGVSRSRGAALSRASSTSTSTMRRGSSVASA